MSPMSRVWVSRKTRVSWVEGMGMPVPEGYPLDPWAVLAVNKRCVFLKIRVYLWMEPLVIYNLILSYLLLIRGQVQ